MKKKKKERLSKDCSKLDMLTGNLRAAVGYSPGSEGIHNGSLELAEEPEASPCAPSQHMEPGPGRGADGVAADPTDARDSRPLLKEAGGKQQGPLSFLLDMMHQHKEGSGKQKLRPTGKASTEPARKPSEPPRARSQAEPKAEVLDLVPLAEQKREERRVSSSKKQPNHIKEEKPQLASPEPASPSGQAQGSKLAPADSPQPKSRNKKSKKKKGDGAGSAIGKYRAGRLWLSERHEACAQCRAPAAALRGPALLSVTPTTRGRRPSLSHSVTLSNPRLPEKGQRIQTIPKPPNQHGITLPLFFDPNENSFRHNPLYPYICQCVFPQKRGISL